MPKKVIIIGAGFAGLSSACFMAKAGWEVQVLEKHDIPGGRARQLNVQGFKFDMGPSWYWMPDVFERFFNCFGKNVSDYYQLERIDPSYRVYWPDEVMNIPANYSKLLQLFEEYEPGSSNKLNKFLEEAEYKYKVGIQKLVFKPGRSISEFADWEMMKGVFRLDVFTSIKSHISKFFQHPKLKQLMEFPVLFLGALPEDTPALYSLMNYADIKLGTWYPKGGIYSVIDAMFRVAKELGVQFAFDQDVHQVQIEKNSAKKIVTKNGEVFLADVVIGAADYHFIDTELLPKESRTYSNAYWESRSMAPGCILYYVGLNRKLENLAHHSLFFDVSFESHAKEIYTSKVWPQQPLFYVSVPSVTDESVAPEGCENLFFLIPVASGLTGDTEELREKYFVQILNRFQKLTGEDISSNIIFKRSYALSEFVKDYNAFKGNAYGLANTLKQTAILKPACRSKKVKNLFYAGQLTVPGPGVPPSLISGEVVANEVLKYFG